MSYDDSSKAGATDTATTFNYRLNLDLNTSTTGKDLLYTRLRTGNLTKGEGFANSNSYLSDIKEGDSTLKVDKLWYSFPSGDFKFTVGALIENYYMVETPTKYKPVLKALKLGGYGAVMGASTGQGFGVQWRQSVPRGQAAWNAAATTLLMVEKEQIQTQLKAYLAQQQMATSLAKSAMEIESGTSEPSMRISKVRVVLTQPWVIQPTWPKAPIKL